MTTESTDEDQRITRQRRRRHSQSVTPSTRSMSSGGWPDGMTSAEFNSHPVRQLLRDAAYFGAQALPTKRGLDELMLPDAVTREIDQFARRLAKIHDDGDHKSAWDQVDDLAADVLSDLDPAELEPANRRRNEPDPLADADPAELADHVLSHGYGSVAAVGRERIDSPRGNRGVDS